MRNAQTNQLVSFAWERYLAANGDYSLASVSNGMGNLARMNDCEALISKINSVYDTDYPSGKKVLELQERFLNNAFRQEHGLENQHFQRIFTQYTEPHRFYHTLEHIARGLEDLDLVRAELQHSEMVKLAWWYHDVIYDTTAKGNEEKSVEILLNETKGRFSSEEREELKALILGTKSHKNPANSDQAYLMDVDLRVMGGESEEFHKYGEAIRQEYSWVDNDSFVYARMEFLQEFLRRPTIFNTKYFRDKYEIKARDNLQKESDYLYEIIMA